MYSVSLHVHVNQIVQTEKRLKYKIQWVSNPKRSKYRYYVRFQIAEIKQN